MILAFTLALVALALICVWGLVWAGKAGRVRERQWRMGLQKLQGFLVHPGLFYHPGHTWVMAEGNGTVRVGIDDFGRKLVDGVRKVKLPPCGTRIHAGESVVKLDCGKREARLVSPVEGVVTAVNDQVAEDSRIFEGDPYGRGWLVRVEVSDRKFTGLPTGAAALDWLKREADRLGVFLHAELGITAADGGELVARPARILDEHQWESLVAAFFHPAGAGDAGTEERLSGKERA